MLMGSPWRFFRPAALALSVGLAACAGGSTTDDKSIPQAEADGISPALVSVQNLYPFTRLRIEQQDGTALSEPVGGIFDENRLAVMPGCHRLTVSDGPGLTFNLLRLSCGSLRFNARGGEDYQIRSRGAGSFYLVRQSDGNIVSRGKMRRIGPFDSCLPDPALACEKSQ
ncbi:MAG: hypothetical protein AAF530_25900 [Pseudomonadota bacterium]